MNQTLRPYQTSAVHAVFDAWEEGRHRILYTLPTGTGKTQVFAELVHCFLEVFHYPVLILAHRVELITQAYQRIAEHCRLNEWQLGAEIAESYAPHSCQVVIGSVMTVINPKRLDWFKPKVIITDESHHASAESYVKIVKRFEEALGERIIHIGCTATAKRTDRASLYALKPDGCPVMLYDKKSKKAYPASVEDSVYEQLVYDYSVLDAIEDGYLVPIKGHTVITDTDLNSVHSRGGDFIEGELAKTVDNNKRTLHAIAAWKQIASDRPTLVFCASVEHAHHAADLWTQAGYGAVALDAQTDEKIRHEAFLNFRASRLQVITNCGIATEGTDLPSCSCIVHLRPTKSWNLYVQMSGRSSRPFPGCIDGIQEAQDRRRAIACSPKPDSVIIDLCDLYEANDLCSAPSILDLPANLDLQGKALEDAAKLLKEFEEVKEYVIGECPTTYEELEVRLETVNLLRGSGAAHIDAWKATDGGYRCVRIPVGYSAELIQIADGWQLIANAGHNRILTKKAPEGTTIKELIDRASMHVGKAIEAHKEALPPASKGTLMRLSVKQINCLAVNGHSRFDIDCMTYGKAKALVGKYMAAWIARKGSGNLFSR